MRVLWVENHAEFVRVAGRQFLSAHTVTVAATLAEARKALAEQTFDVVLLDYDLDDGKGTSLFAVLDELANRPVVIAVSAHEHGNTSLSLAGAVAVCAKGRFDGIEAAIQSALAARR